MQRLTATKAALYKAVEHIERLHEGKAEAAEFSIQGFPHAELFFRTVLVSAVRQKRPTCVLSESFPPDQIALHLMCFQARISPADVATRKLNDIGIAQFTHAAARISGSPLHLAGCADGDIEGIAWELFPLINAGEVQVVVCEKHTAEHLDAWQAELEFLSKSGGVEVHLLAGRTLSPYRLHPNQGQRL